MSSRRCRRGILPGLSCWFKTGLTWMWRAGLSAAATRLRRARPGAAARILVRILVRIQDGQHRARGAVAATAPGNYRRQMMCMPTADSRCRF